MSEANDLSALVMRQCCSVELPTMRGGNWGDLRCSKCGVAYCQDCGSQINMQTMCCIAYEDDAA